MSPKTKSPPVPVAGSESAYNPAQCLRAEVERFKATNRFTPLEVTGFYIQAAVVLDEHSRMVEALRQLAECNLTDDNCAGLDVANGRIRSIARRALPMSETVRKPDTAATEAPREAKCGVCKAPIPADATSCDSCGSTDFDT